MADNKAAKPEAEKPKKMTKAAIYQALANETELTRKKVGELFEAMTKIIKKELSKKGPGEFTIPGLLKLRVQRKPATKARKAPNPFKPGEEITIKAKPARNVVRARALKALNDLIK